MKYQVELYYRGTFYIEIDADNAYEAAELARRQAEFANPYTELGIEEVDVYVEQIKKK